MAVHTVIGVILVVWTALAGRSAAQQQQPAALPSATADEVYGYIARAVQQELQPVVRRFESRVESLDNRLTLLDSRVSALTAHVLTNRLGEQMEELSSQLDSQHSQLNNLTAQLNARLDSQQFLMSKLNTQLNEQKSQQEETAATVNNVTAQLDIIVTQQGDQLNQTSHLATTLDSQQSQLSELNNQLNEQKSQQEETAATVNNVTAQLDTLVTQQGDQLTQTSQLATMLDSQHSQLSELNTQLNDCSDLSVGSPSGVYLLRPSGSSTQPPVEAYCDMDTAGGNWTVIQRRDDIKPHQDFYLGWKEYKEGFGYVTKEFWWGLKHLFQLTSSGRRYELRIDLEAFDGSRRYAIYQGFRISSELYGYRLSASNYSGTAGDGLYWSVNKKFSTRDRDQDGHSGRHCARDHQGAWWYGRWMYGVACGRSSLNGRYRDDGNWDGTGIWWRKWRRYASLKKSDMKIRPTY